MVYLYIQKKTTHTDAIKLSVINLSTPTCHVVIHTLVVGSISRVGEANTSWCLQVNHISLCRVTQHKTTKQ